MKRYHSCYIVDVQVNDDGSAVLTDSTRVRWYVDAGNPGFKKYFDTKFLSGVSQTLTVFSYEDRGNGPDIENYVVKFFGV